MKIDTKKYGIGAALLAKMGYREGQGLGQDGQGIAEPIEVKLRKGKSGINYGGFKEKTAQAERDAHPDSSEEEREEMEEKIEGWKAELAGEGGRKKKKKKTVYKTVEDLVAENEGRPAGRVQDKIVDMTGPGERVLTNFSELASSKTATYHLDSHFPELRYNLRHIADLHAGEVQAADRAIRRDVELLERLQKDRLELERDTANEGARIARLEQVKTIVADCRDKARSPDNSFTVESFSRVFADLRSGYPEEYRSHHLSSLAVAIAHPLLRQELADWAPLDNPLEHLDLFKKWKDLLRDDGGGRDGTMTPYDNVLYHLWLPKIRSAVSNAWSPKNPEPLVRLVEGWQLLIPRWMLDNILGQLVLPKLTAAVDEWNPKKDPVPIHLWVHPWLPFLGEALQSLFVPIRYKMGVVLEGWEPSDPSANAILLPWKYVFKRPDLDALLMKSVYPKLVLVLRDFVINPANQVLEPLQWVMIWGNLLPSATFIGLWVNEFFPKWLDILHQWLVNSPNFDEVTQWYLGWKGVFPVQLLSQQAISLQFNKGLDMMNILLSGSTHQLKESMARFRQAERKDMDHVREQATASASAAAAAAQAKKKRPAEQATLKDTLQQLAEQHNVVFVPSGQTREGRPTFKFGTKVISIDKEVITVLYNGSWNRIQLDDLVTLAVP